MSRLLFAAARGARVQTWAGVLGWRSTNLFGPWSYDDGDRIHPADEHLQYGPISTALREIAFADDCNLVDLPYIEVALLREEGHYPITKEQFGVFLLILAEALADSGL